MIKKTALCLLLCVLLITVFSACQKEKTSSEAKNELVGTWLAKDIPVYLPMSISFRSTGLGSRDGNAFSYEISGGNIYVYSGTESETWSYTVSGNKLTLSTLPEKIEYEKSQ